MKTSHPHKRIAAPLALALALAVAPVAAAAPSSSAAGCATHWGSLVKKQTPSTSGQITGVRSGRHRCFDRLVVDVNAHRSGRPGYRVGYVKTVALEGAGSKVPLRGGARLQIVVRAPAYDDHGRATYTPAHPKELVDVSGYRTFRQVAWAGSFEGQTTIGLGVRARLPFRVFVLDAADGGHRVVVDVAHRWG